MARHDLRGRFRYWPPAALVHDMLQLMMAGEHELIVVRARVDPDLVVRRDEFPQAHAVGRESSEPGSGLCDLEPRARFAKHAIRERLPVSWPRIVGGIATEPVQELLSLVLRLLRITAATAAAAPAAHRFEFDAE